MNAASVGALGALGLVYWVCWRLFRAVDRRLNEARKPPHPERIEPWPPRARDEE